MSQPDALIGTHITRTIRDPGARRRMALRFVVTSAEYVDVRYLGHSVDVINIYDHAADQTRVHERGQLAPIVNEWIAGQDPGEIIKNVNESLLYQGC